MTTAPHLPLRRGLALLLGLLAAGALWPAVDGARASQALLAGVRATVAHGPAAPGPAPDPAAPGRIAPGRIAPGRGQDGAAHALPSGARLSAAGTASRADHVPRPLAVPIGAPVAAVAPAPRTGRAPAGRQAPSVHGTASRPRAPPLARLG